jgi:hypothetical protein
MSLTTTINLQIESLIGAVQALSPAEQSIVRSRLFPNAVNQPPKQSVLDILNEASPSQLFALLKRLIDTCSKRDPHGTANPVRIESYLCRYGGRH